MDEVIGVALRAMQHDVSRLERVSANLANALTPGYKREVLLQRADTQGVAGTTFARAWQQEAAGVVSGAAAQPTAQVRRDLRSGTLKATGQNLDVALAGRGFFEVATPQGPAYTRHGQFQVDGHGRLVTQQGHPVMGRSGEITVLPGPVSIDLNGTVSQSSRMMGQLKVVDFGQAEMLQPADGGLFAAGAQANLLDGPSLELRQGYLENANVNSMHEMVELMRTMRHFESMHRVIQSYDEMLGSAVRKLGEL